MIKNNKNLIQKFVYIQKKIREYIAIQQSNPEIYRLIKNSYQKKDC